MSPAAAEAAALDEYKDFGNGKCQYVELNVVMLEDSWSSKEDFATEMPRIGWTSISAESSLHSDN